MDRLPEELLAAILRRLPPRPLAVCRSVSKSLRAAIDGRGLLLAVGFAARVPRGLRGFFINFVGQDRPYFFSRPAAAAAGDPAAIDARLTFLPRLPGRDDGWREVVHHCNGLLLVQDWGELYVCNPATRRWQHLPPPPPPPSAAEAVHAHIAFDPTVSLHYEVFFFAEAPRKPKVPIQPDIERRRPVRRNLREYTDEEIEDLPSSLRDEYDREAQVKGLAEWPPSSYVAQVFSSRTGRWEERRYVREDDVAVTLWDVWSDPWALENQLSMSYNAPRCNAVYWRGAFYLHCRGGFIMRLSLLEQKYQVIKTPKLDNVFVPPTLDVADFLSREDPYTSKEECLREFLLAQKCLDNLKPSMHLGKSKHGIYYAAICWHQLRVWVLQEASVTRPMPDWDLKYMADLEPSFLQDFYSRDNRKKLKTPWCLYRGQKRIREAKGRQVSGWDSSDDSGMDVAEHDSVYSDAYNCDITKIDFLGYHPNKEIAFLGNEDFDGFAYYLESSKLQYLGTFEPVGCCHKQVAATHESFIYTPCVDDLLPNSKDGGGHRQTRGHIKLEDEGFRSQ